LKRWSSGRYRSRSNKQGGLSPYGKRSPIAVDDDKDEVQVIDSGNDVKEFAASKRKRVILRFVTTGEAIDSKRSDLKYISNFLIR
jgi:hypothetical protein